MSEGQSNYFFIGFGDLRRTTQYIIGGLVELYCNGYAHHDRTERETLGSSIQLDNRAAGGRASRQIRAPARILVVRGTRNSNRSGIPKRESLLCSDTRELTVFPSRPPQTEEGTDVRESLASGRNHSLTVAVLMLTCGGSAPRA